jgi:FtsZ-interacting cell division protein ZipA
MRNLTTGGLTFLIDVPRVHGGERVYAMLLDQARRFAEALQGMLVDDNRQPLTDAQLEQIRREYVIKPQESMQAFGIPAGSPLALRLFC